MTLQIERDLKYSIDRPLNRCVTPKYLSIVKEKATAAITKKNTIQFSKLFDILINYVGSTIC